MATNMTKVTHNGLKSNEDGKSDEQFAQKMYEVLKAYLSTTKQLSFLVAGKTGVGKSSLINSIIGCESLAEEGATVQSVTPDLTRYSVSKRTPIPGRENEDTVLTAWDAPGFGDFFVEEAVERERLSQITQAIGEADVFLFCFKISERMSNDDGRGLIDITNKLGPDIWKKALFVLTFANKLEVPSPPPDPGITRTQYCGVKLQEWRRSITHALRVKAKVPEDIASNISVIPVGHHHDNPPGVSDWFSSFWAKLFEKTRESGQPALLRLAWDRTGHQDIKAPEPNTSSKKSNILRINLFRKDGFMNSVEEIRQSPLPSSHLVISGEPRGRSVSQQPSMEPQERPSPGGVAPPQEEEEPRVQPGEQTWRKAGKIGLLVGGGVVAGAIIGVLIGLVGGPPGMGIGLAAGATIGGGTGAGTAIARAIFKRIKSKKQKDKETQHLDIENTLIN